MFKLTKLSKAIVALGVAFSVSVAFPTVAAENKPLTPQEERAKERKTNILSERIGKKVQKAYELYTQDQVPAAITALKEIEASKPFDKAFVNKMIGNLLAGDETKGAEALSFLLKSVEPDVLNYKEQEQTMKLVADLSMQEKKFKQAITWYYKWIDFTGLNESMTYLKIANAYYELKQLDKVIEPADLAIKYQEELKPEPYILKMASYYERKMYPQATVASETLVKLFPEDKRWWAQLGMFYLLIEDYDRALSAMELAYKQGYLEKETEIKTLSQLYASNNMPYRSAKLLEKFLKQGLVKRTKQNLSAIANSFLAALNIESAAFYYGEAAKLENDPELYRKQGALLLQAEKYSGAVKALKKALELEIKETGKTNMSLAQAYFYQRKYNQAYSAVLAAMKDKRTSKTAKAWKSYVEQAADRNSVKLTAKK